MAKSAKMFKLKGVSFWLVLLGVVIVAAIFVKGTYEGFKTLTAPVTLGKFKNNLVELKGWVFTGILDTPTTRSFGPGVIIVSYPKGKLVWNSMTGEEPPKPAIKAKYAVIGCSPTPENIMTMEQLSFLINRMVTGNPMQIHNFIVLDGKKFKFENGKHLPFTPKCPA